MPSPSDSKPPRPDRSPWLRRRVSWEERKRLLYREGWIAAIAVHALLAAAWVAPADGLGDGDFATSLFCAAMGVRILTLHLAGLVTVVFLVAAARRRGWLAFASSPAGVFFLVYCGVSFVPGTPMPLQGRPLKIMSVNLLMVNRDTQPTIDEIRREGPDVVSFQEYTLSWHSALCNALADRYPYEVHDCREDSFGGAIYSKVPILNEQADFSLGGGAAEGTGFIDVPAFRVELAHEGNTWVVYNVHMLPPRLVSYVRVQRRQFRELAARLGAERHPTLVTGDFNWNQFTQYHHGMKRIGFVSGQARAGSGLGNTWPVNGALRYVPGVRLDHVYMRGLECIEFRTGGTTGSDHRAVIAVVGLPLQ